MSKKDLSGNSKITVDGDFCISTKMTLGGLQYLEDRYGRATSEIDLASGKADDVINMLTSFGISANPDMTPDEVRNRICSIPADSLDAIMSQLPDTQPKNPTRGNLQESR